MRRNSGRGEDAEGTHLCFGLIRGHEVRVRTNLGQHAIYGHLVEALVAREVPVLDQGHEHSASFPPVVWRIKNTHGMTRLIAVIVAHHSVRGDAGSGFE